MPPLPLRPPLQLLLPPLLLPLLPLPNSKQLPILQPLQKLLTLYRPLRQHNNPLHRLLRRAFPFYVDAVDEVFGEVEFFGSGGVGCLLGVEGGMDCFEVVLLALGVGLV